MPAVFFGVLEVCVVFGIVYVCRYPGVVCGIEVYPWCRIVCASWWYVVECVVVYVGIMWVDGWGAFGLVDRVGVRVSLYLVRVVERWGRGAKIVCLASWVIGEGIMLRVGRYQGNIGV